MKQVRLYRKNTEKMVLLRDKNVNSQKVQNIILDCNRFFPVLERKILNLKYVLFSFLPFEEQKLFFGPDYDQKSFFRFGSKWSDVKSIIVLFFSVILGLRW